MPGPWTPARRRKFQETMARKREAREQPALQPAAKIKIAYSRSKRQLVLVIDDSQLPLEIVP